MIQAPCPVYTGKTVFSVVLQTSFLVSLFKNKKMLKDSLRAIRMRVSAHALYFFNIDTHAFLLNQNTHANICS
jgi:hypothetical protein